MSSCGSGSQVSLLETRLAGKRKEHGARDTFHTIRLVLKAWGAKAGCLAGLFRKSIQGFGQKFCKNLMIEAWGLHDAILQCVVHGCV